MVLQNKYKAKASRRYNSHKASADDGEPSSSSKPGYRHRFANKHGRNGQQESHGNDDRSGEDDSAEGSVGSSDEEDQDAEFPSLAKAAANSDASHALESEQDPSNPSRGKYARRKLGESKLARLERLEAAKDPRLPDDDDEPEPEIDISNLVARVAALGDCAGTQAGVAEEIARSRGQHETASDVENDIDHSLAYLHEKERQRQKAKGRGGAVHSPRDDAGKVGLGAHNVDADGNAIDYEALAKEKEKAEAVRALKARFQGHGVGERRPDSKARTVPSIHIGPAQAASSSKTPSSDTTGAATTNGTLSDSLAAEIESSLAKSRSSSGNGETASVNSGRSSFSTTFGRRKSPLASNTTTSTTSNSPAERPHSGSSSSSAAAAAHRTERIDSFLFSLNDRSAAVKAKDPSAFALSSAGLSPQLNRSSSRFDGTLTPQGQKGGIHSTPGQLGRLESFLDDMLG